MCRSWHGYIIRLIKIKILVLTTVWAYAYQLLAMWDRNWLFPFTAITDWQHLYFLCHLYIKIVDYIRQLVKLYGILCQHACTRENQILVQENKNMMEACVRLRSIAFAVFNRDMGHIICLSKAKTHISKIHKPTQNQNIHQNQRLCLSRQMICIQQFTIENILMIYINTLRLGQSGRHFAEDVFKWISLNGNVWILIIKNHLSFFLTAQLTPFQHWFR